MPDYDRYSADEIERIKADVLDPKVVAKCPRCGGGFDTRVIGGGGTINHVSEYACVTCEMAIALADVY